MRHLSNGIKTMQIIGIRIVHSQFYHQQTLVIQHTDTGITDTNHHIHSRFRLARPTYLMLVGIHIQAFYRLVKIIRSRVIPIGHIIQQSSALRKQVFHASHKFIQDVTKTYLPGCVRGIRQSLIFASG